MREGWLSIAGILVIRPLLLSVRTRTLMPVFPSFSTSLNWWAPTVRHRVWQANRNLHRRWIRLLATLIVNNKTRAAPSYASPTMPSWIAKSGRASNMMTTILFVSQISMAELRHPRPRWLLAQSIFSWEPTATRSYRKYPLTPVAVLNKTARDFCGFVISMLSWLYHWVLNSRRLQPLETLLAG